VLRALAAGHASPPHPVPLPKGSGNARIVLYLWREGRSSFSLSPWGEGWGEGVFTVSSNNAAAPAGAELAMTVAEAINRISRETSIRY
jgi:hypothetical protein